MVNVTTGVLVEFDKEGAGCPLWTDTPMPRRMRQRPVVLPSSSPQAAAASASRYVDALTADWAGRDTRCTFIFAVENLASVWNTFVALFVPS